MPTIERLRIQGLRGIRHAEMHGFSNLTIVVGPNGAGKSTLLDAMLLASSPTPADAVGRVVRRRTAVVGGAPWIFWRGDTAAEVLVSVNSNRPDDRMCRIKKADFLEFPHLADSAFGLEVRTWIGPPTLEEVHGMYAVSEWVVGLSRENEYTAAVRIKGNWTGPYVRLIDPAPGGNQAPLSRVYSSAVREGRGPWARDVLKRLVPGFENLEILTDEFGDPVVHIIYTDRSIPLGLAGDGIQVLTRVCLELASISGGLILLEEPEVHQYPRSLMMMSKAIVETSKRNVQVVLSTHSLDLIRYLIDDAKQADVLDSLSVFKTRLSDGNLSWSRLAGPDAELKLETLGDDLR